MGTTTDSPTVWTPTTVGRLPTDSLPRIRSPGRPTPSGSRKLRLRREPVPPAGIIASAVTAGRADPPQAQPFVAWALVCRAAPALMAYLFVRLTGLVALQFAAAANGRDVQRLLVSWDAQWYAGVAAHGYGFDRLQPDGRQLFDYAFFPLYPFLERIVGQLTGLTYVDAGLLISALASVVAAGGIFAVAETVLGRRVALIATVTWAVVPVGIVEWMAYTESLFTALAAWALLAVLRERWTLAGALACLAGAARPVGLAVAVAVAVPAVMALSARRRAATRQRTASGARAAVPASAISPLLAAVVAPLGWLGYVGWVSAQTGDPLGYFNVAAQWGNGLDGGAAFARWTSSLLAGGSPGSGLLLCLGVLTLAGLLLGCLRLRLPLPLVVFSVAMVVLAFATSGYFGSKLRYLLPAFPLVFPLAAYLSRRRTATAAAVLAVAALTSAAYGASWLLSAGPP